MKKMGFKRTILDAGIFVHQDDKGGIVIAEIYIDDSKFMGSPKELVIQKKKEFIVIWDCRDLGHFQTKVIGRIDRPASWMRC